MLFVLKNMKHKCLLFANQVAAHPSHTLRRVHPAHPSQDFWCYVGESASSLWGVWVVYFVSRLGLSRTLVDTYTISLLNSTSSIINSAIFHTYDSWRRPDDAGWTTLAFRIRKDRYRAAALPWRYAAAALADTRRSGGTVEALTVKIIGAVGELPSK